MCGYTALYKCKIQPRFPFLIFGVNISCVATIYRPPPKAKSPNVPVFLKEFADLLEDLTLTSGQLLLVGDLNFHFDNPTSAHTKPIIDLLTATNHQQHVNLATHQKGHILDVIITRRDELPIADITCDESVNSDHSAVIFTVPTTHIVQPKRMITVRKLKNFNTQQISHDIDYSDLIAQQAGASAAEAFSCYNNTLLSILDQHAPARKCNITVKNNVPWYNADIKAAKAKRKRLEHQCRKTQLTVHRDMFTCQRNKVNTMCAEAKKTYYKEKLSDIRSHAQFYNIANKLLHRRKTITLPNYECAETLANKFAGYFDEKIRRIRTTLQTPHSCAIDCTVCTNRPDTDCQLSSFVTVTRAEITQLLPCSR